ncbi:MAG: hypothetical protein AAGN35_10085 [Bacteroidota bacterium]
MELIYDILKKLKRYEKRQIRNYFNASPFEYEKVGELFKLVTRYSDKEEAFFSQKLYGRDPDNTFRVTKARLKKVLEDTVLNDKSFSEYSADFIKAALFSNKRVLQGEILLGRGAYAASKNLLLQVIAKTKKFSLHGERFRAEMLLHRNQSINMSVNEFQKRTRRLLELNEINYKVNQAAIIHYSVTNILTHKSLSNEELKHYEEEIRRIETIAEETQSPLARQHYLMSRILFLQYNYQYKEAIEFCRLQIELLEQEPAVRSSQRLGSAQFQLTEALLRSGQLEEAAASVNATLNFFSREETNYLIVLGTAFRVAFFSDRWDKAEKIVQEAFDHPRFAASPFRAAIWHYCYSCVMLKTGQTSQALRALNESTLLLSDKMGWNLTFRLHEIMVLFEAEMYDLLETKILNMRQFVKRTQKNSDLYRPMKLIQILMEWHKNSLDIKKTYGSIKKQLTDLRNYHKEIPFDPSTGELIRLENWMAEKNHNLVRP